MTSSSAKRRRMLIEVWPALADDVKGEILRLAGYDFNDVMTEAASAGEAVSLS